MSLAQIKYERDRKPDHVDHRRELWVAFNGDWGFTAAQVKILDSSGNLVDVVLGGHSHPYRELFFVLAGQAVFKLKDPDTGEIREYELVKGSRLLITGNVPHQAIVNPDTILIGMTEEVFVSQEVSQRPAQF